VQLAQVGQVPTPRALYRFRRDLGDAIPGVILLALADAAGSRGMEETGTALTSEGWVRHVTYMNSLLVRSLEGRGIVDAPRLLTGADIMALLGIPPGPEIGRLLEALAEAQGTGVVTDIETARAFVVGAAARAETEHTGP
jgi:hypothetical protein